MAITNVSQENFEEEVLQAQQKVLVDFNADWCGPCQMLGAILEEFAQESDIKIASINIDENEELAEKYEVSSIPCLIVFDKGVEKKRSVGLISKNDLKKLVEG